MSAVERLQAAIKKLESQRQASYGAGKYTWWMDPQEANMAFDAEVRAEGAPDGFHDGIAMVCDQSDAELIVTLHRTIDAQLGILREAVYQLTDLRAAGLLSEEHNLIVALADAIMGDQS